MKYNKEEIVREVGKGIMRPIGIIQGVFIMLLFVCPFVLIWFSGVLTLKLFLTAIAGILITKFFHFVAKKLIDEVVETELEDELNKRSGGSKFQVRVRELMNEKEE